ncbi:beta strand repeat-containing protein [Methylosinus sporium]|uniref:beta strand repeat-containing protein n=1 Tax=Methylosinus sporium TaxID=428 RepID=UPI00383A0120
MFEEGGNFTYIPYLGVVTSAGGFALLHANPELNVRWVSFSKDVLLPNGSVNSIKGGFTANAEQALEKAGIAYQTSNSPLQLTSGYTIRDARVAGEAALRRELEAEGFRILPGQNGNGFRSFASGPVQIGNSPAWVKGGRDIDVVGRKWGALGGQSVYGEAKATRVSWGSANGWNSASPRIDATVYESGGIGHQIAKDATAIQLNKALRGVGAAAGVLGVAYDTVSTGIIVYRQYSLGDSPGAMLSGLKWIGRWGGGALGAIGGSLVAGPIGGFAGGVGGSVGGEKLSELIANGLGLTPKDSASPSDVGPGNPNPTPSDGITGVAQPSTDDFFVRYEVTYADGRVAYDVPASQVFKNSEGFLANGIASVTVVRANGERTTVDDQGNVLTERPNRAEEQLQEGRSAYNGARDAYDNARASTGGAFSTAGDPISSFADGISNGIGNFFSGISALFSGGGDAGGGPSVSEEGAQANSGDSRETWWDSRNPEDWWISQSPVVVDLDGNGIKITPYSSSNVFYDTAADGYQHRTAWAAAGDAILAIDANNDGNIDQTNEIVFTQWDPTASSDMQALLDVFDTNHNGQLDSGDAKFSQFRLVVTNANGTQTVETLGQAGVASIGLHEDNYSQTFSDGSTINGETTFTRTDGSTGTAASVTLVSNAAGYALQTAQSVDGAGTVTVDNKAFNPDGSLANESISITSANGNSKTLQRDVDGDGVIDLIQTDSIVTNGDGSKTETLIDVTASGVTLDKTVTWTSPDGRTTSIQRDLDGSGVFEQTELFTINGDGSHTDVVSDLADNGATIDKTTTIISADGKTRITQSDINGDGANDTTTADITGANGLDQAGIVYRLYVAALGREPESNGFDGWLTGSSSGQSLSSAEAGFVESTESQNKYGWMTNQQYVVQIFNNAFGRNPGSSEADYWTNALNSGTSREQFIDAVIHSPEMVAHTAASVSSWLAANGGQVETITDKNNDGSLRDNITTWTSVDGHWKSSLFDLDGNGTIDLRTIETVADNGDGSHSVIQTDYNGDGSLRDRTQTWLSGDNLSKTTWLDKNGDGVWDVTTTDDTVVNGDGSRTETTTDYSADGSKRDQTIVTKGADGRSRTIQFDQNGDGAFDHIETIVVSNGASVDTTGDYAANGALLDKTIVSTSADGLTTTTQLDGNGDGAVDLTTTQTTVKNGDGSSATTLSNYNHDGLLRSQNVVTTSANGLVTTTTTDRNGDGSVDLSTTDATIVNGDGSRTETVTQVNNDGSWRSHSVTTTSADRRKVDIVLDTNGDHATDRTESRVIGSDGSTTDKILDFSADGALHAESITTTTATGLWTGSWTDLNGDGVWDTTKADSVTLNADGSRWEWVTITNADGSMRTQTAVLTSANGLSTTTWVNADGIGGWDLVTTDNITLNNDGSRWEWITDSNGDGSRRDEIATLTSANGLSKTTWTDPNGDGRWDRIETDVTVLSTNGGSVRTVADTNGAGALRGQMITTVSGDGRSTNISTDSNGDGHVDSVETTSVAANGDVIDTVTHYDPTGIGRSQTVTTTSGSGLYHSVAVDQNDDGHVDLTTQSTTSLDPDGGKTTTTLDINANGSWRDKTVVTVRADGLLTTTWVDVDGDGLFDSTNTDVTVLNSDGSRTHAVSTYNRNASLRDRTVTTQSSDLNSTYISHDVNGDGIIDGTETLIIQSDGSRVDTISYLNSDGSVKNQRVTTTSADGLSTTTSFNSLTISVSWVYLWGNLYPIQTQSFGATATIADVTVLNNDGSRTRSYVHHNGDGGASVDDQIVTTSSANGLWTSSHWIGSNGSSSIDLTTTDATTINGDGSRTRAVSDTQTSFLLGSPTLMDQSITTVSASGLSTDKKLDVNGDGTFDLFDTIVVDGDGNRLETITKRNTDGSSREINTSSVSWDGRSTLLKRDTDGDGTIDHYETSQIESDGTTTNIVLDTNADGSTRGRIVIRTSADGLSKFSEFDTNGDGLSDWSQRTSETLNVDGSRTVSVSDFNGNGSLRDRVVTTTSDDGLSKTSQIDTNGSANAIETETDVTVLNDDGSSARTVTGYYADGGLKDHTVTTVSANGRSVTTTIDINGDGNVDRTDTSTVADDGTKTSTINYRDGSSVTVTTSFDGRTTTLSLSSHITQTTVAMPDSSGSYSWRSTDSNGYVLGSSSHTIDASGVDIYSYSNQNGSGTIRVDVATEQEDLSIIQRIYDTAFDRDMTQDEKETFGRYVNGNGSLNTSQLASDLIGSTEFSTRYGGLSNLEFVERIYQNAYGRSISVNDLTAYVAQLSDGAASRGGLLNLVSASSEHVLDGNVHATTNNSVTSAASYSLDHTMDRQIASDEVVRTYRTALGRDPSGDELSGGVQAIVNGNNTEAQIANTLVSPVWTLWPYFSNPSPFDQTFGSLSNSDFVTRLYLNAFGRNPTAQESSNWVALLDAGSVSRGDVIYAIAESPDYLSDTGSHAGQTIVASNQSFGFAANVTVNITGGANTIYGSDGDILSFVGNGAWGPDNLVYLSSGAANLGDDSRMDVFGSGDAINVGNNSTVGVNGGNNSIVAGRNNSIIVNSGTGNVANASNDTFALASNVSIGIIGSGNVVYSQAGNHIGIAGNGPNGASNILNISNGLVDLGDGARADVHGSGNSITLAGDDVLSVVGGGDTVSLHGSASNAMSLFDTNGSWDAVFGSNGTISLHNAQTNVTGCGDTINFDGSSTDALSLFDSNGNWDAVFGSNGTLGLHNAQTNVTGGGDTIYFDGSSTNALSLFDSNGNWDAVFGSNGTLGLHNAQTNVTGGGDTIYFDGSSTNALSLFDSNGNWDAIFGSNGTLGLHNAQTNVTGGGNTIYFDGSSSNAMSLFDTNGNWDHVYGSNGTLGLHNAQADVTGGGNTIYGSNGAILSIGGNGAWGNDNCVYFANGTVNLENDSRLDVFGSGNAINLGSGSVLGVNSSGNSIVSGTNDTIFLNSGSGNVANASYDTFALGSNVNVDIFGNGDTIYFGAANQVNSNGDSNTFVFQSNFGHDSISGFNSTDALRVDHTAFADWSHLLGATQQVGSDTVITLDAADSITLKNFAVTSLTQSQVQIV